MPELPEAERARRQLELVVGREIVAVDDRDTYVCRPHAPGEMAAALVGHRLVETHRRGKFLWAETDGGPQLGLHLGMAGSLTVDQAPAPRNWDRFVLEFADGGRLALRDKRRLGRAVLEPDFSHVGPDAAEVGRDEFRERVGRGTAPLKARLLDQGVISGVGNLLADEILWRARLSPRRPAGELPPTSSTCCAARSAPPLRDAIRNGGAHTGHFTPRRERGGTLPALRHRARAGHDRRPDDVLVPGLPANVNCGGVGSGEPPRGFRRLDPAQGSLHDPRAGRDEETGSAGLPLPLPSRS